MKDHFGLTGKMSRALSRVVIPKRNYNIETLTVAPHRDRRFLVGDPTGSDKADRTERL